MTDLFTGKVTIYNDIQADDISPRRFERFVIDKCSIQKGILHNADGTVENVKNAHTVISKDAGRYKAPLEYFRLPQEARRECFTAQVNDFVVLSEVDDAVTTEREFRLLQEKYKDNGFSVTAINVHIFGMSADNVQLIHA